MDDNTEWAWGKFIYTGQFALFDSEETSGGYKCKFCGMQLKKRPDGLSSHIRKAHKEILEDEINNIMTRIPKVAVKCPKCKLPLTSLGNKMKNHLNKYCKGENLEDKISESSEKDSMNREVEDNGSTMEEENPNVTNQVRDKGKRKIAGAEVSIWEKVKVPIKRALKEVDEEKNNFLK